MDAARKGLLLLSMGLLLAPWGARAEYFERVPLESPSWFVQASGGYGYRSVAQGQEQLGFFFLTLLPYDVQGGSAGGRATIPIWRELGARVRAGGGKSELQLRSASLDIASASGGFELFWRDPTRGQVAVGYAYGWEGSSLQGVEATGTEHVIPVRTSIYFPEIEGGLIDWHLDFQYAFTSFESNGDRDDGWRYGVGWTSYWYLNRFVGFEGGVDFTQVMGQAASSSIEGIFRLEVLVPGGSRHYGTVSVTGRVGRIEDQELPAPFSSGSQSTWSVGAGATVHFPGVGSLIELNRAYR